MSVYLITILIAYSNDVTVKPVYSGHHNVLSIGNLVRQVTGFNELLNTCLLIDRLLVYTGNSLSLSLSLSLSVCVCVCLCVLLLVENSVPLSSLIQNVRTLHSQVGSVIGQSDAGFRFELCRSLVGLCH